MNEYKHQQRRKKRGDHCLVGPYYEEGWMLIKGVYYWVRLYEGRICGCGSRHAPTKKHKKRIIRRNLKAQLRQEISEV